MNRMKIAGLSSFALLLGGCATPQEVRQTGAVKTFTSEMPARTVADCIARGIEDLGYASHMQFRPTVDGYTLSVIAGANTLYTIDVRDHTTGSITNYYLGNSFGGKAQRLEMLAACQ